jgi:RecA-family ATPase
MVGGTAMSIEFSSMMQPVAYLLLGEPNHSLSSEKELRYGSRGSLSVDLTKGTWFDNEAGKGGGVLDLITREKNIEGNERFEWLRKNGFDIGEERKPNGKHGPTLGPIVAIYPYTDETGKLLFQVTRHDPKDFRQRKPDGNGGWIWGVRGIRPVPYRLPDIIEHKEHTIVIVEGEKDADRLWQHNIPATTNAGGVGKWRPQLSDFFSGCDVVIMPDRDPQKTHQKTGEPLFHDDGRPVLPGQDHAQAIARSLSGIAARVRLVELWNHWPEMPLKGDVSDWFERGGGTAEKLHNIIDITPDWLSNDEPELVAPPLPWIIIREWDGMDPPKRQWAIFNRTPINQAGLFSGEGGTGKSIIELTKNVAHVMGKDWLGSTPEVGPTFYIGAEDEADELHRRLAAIKHFYGVTFKELAENGFYMMTMIGKDATLVAVSKSGKVETTALYKRLYEAAGDIKPRNISIDTLSHAFAGNEIDRVQVYAFAMNMQSLALASGGSVTILSHPSLAGMASGSGLSGSTAWHSAFRFRHYLKGAKKNNDDDTDISDVREIEFKKNQYGPLGETITVKYEHGLFVHKHGAPSLEQIASARKADDVFLTLLQRFTRQNRVISEKPSRNYAPVVFAREEEAQQASVTAKKLEEAMRRLFKEGKIANEPYGPPSRKAYQITFIEGVR